jgi:hypothetical protein
MAMSLVSVVLLSSQISFLGFILAAFTAGFGILLRALGQWGSGDAKFLIAMSPLLVVAVNPEFACALFFLVFSASMLITKAIMSTPKVRRSLEFSSVPGAIPLAAALVVLVASAYR